MESSSWALLAVLGERRRALGMTIPQLAKRSGVSTATVGRVLRGEPSVAFGHVLAVAEALGLQLLLRSAEPVDAFRRRAVRSKAQRAVSLVQATSSLEAQGLSQEEFDAMVDRASRELLAGSGRQIWAE